MGIFSVNGKQYEVNSDGHLADPSQWDEKVAEHIARREGLELTEKHREIIRFLREYFQLHSMSPKMKVLMGELKKKFGADKGHHKYLYQLFPQGPSKQGARIAGLPMPDGEIDW